MSCPSERVRCPNCREDTISALHWKNPRFHQCRRCGLIFRVPFPTLTTLAALYNTSWTAADENPSETGATGSVDARTFVGFLLRALGKPSFSGNRILDFGAGRGAMASALREAGAEILAIEPFGSDYLKGLGFNAHRDLDELPSHLRFDGIVSLEVLEHLLEPREALARLYGRLVDGGWLFVTTPNAAGLPAKLHRERWREAAKAGHVLFFTPATLKRILVETGFRDVRRLRWLVRYSGAPRLRAALHFVLQSVLQDGHLRFLAHKA